MTPQVAVIGAGSWGTTVASLAAAQAPTMLWARRAEAAEEIVAAHTNSRYLGQLPLSPGLRATEDLAEAARAADVLVLGVPSHSCREVLEQVADHLRPWIPVVSLVKLQGLAHVIPGRGLVAFAPVEAIFAVLVMSVPAGTLGPTKTV